MEFCPKCSTRLVLRKHETKTDRLVLACPKCAYNKEATSEEVSPITTINHKTQEHVAVIGKEESKIRTMPTMKSECPKCNNKEAYWWMVQTRGSDESPTQFFRCTVCGYTRRESA